MKSKGFQVVVGLFFGIFVGISVLFLGACSSQPKLSQGAQFNTQFVQPDLTGEQIMKSCDTLLLKLKERLDQLIQLKTEDPSFASTFGELENAGADFMEGLSPLTFLKSVATDTSIRKASEQCATKSSSALIDFYNRKDLYQVLKKAESGLAKKHLSTAEQRLISETMKEFKLNGLDLAEQPFQKFQDLQKELSRLKIEFQSHLNDNKDAAEMTEVEMVGIPDSVKSRFKKLPNGSYQIPAKATFYSAFMENAADANARKKMASVYENREAKANTELLKKIIQIRREIANLAGFKDWADYSTYNRMAKTGKNAWNFLQDLKGKLSRPYAKDQQELLAFKRTLDPQAKILNPWDVGYLSYQLKKKKYDVDGELVREYFPADFVVAKVLEIYSKILGVRFQALPQAKTWHPSVQLFEIRDAATDKVQAYFYTDLYPREGKYGHAAAFSIRIGREINGEYRSPVSAIVANFTPPTSDKPSLLSHGEVETFFHEFGHIMHQTLTRVPFASLAGTSVARDFVEAPSQMLENWVWQPEILKFISAHYKDSSKKIPDELIQNMIRAQKFNQAVAYTRQLFFGIYDLTLHRSPRDLDVTETYKKIYREVVKLEPLDDTHFPANFGHLMGYSAGYYGYLWSEVFAFDMFTSFENGKLLSPEVGARYRAEILEKGGMQDADQLLKNFLGRKPNSDAFFRYLGI